MIVKTPISGAVAIYGGGDALRLPIIGLDDRDQPLVLTRDGRVVLATKARPGGRTFEAVEPGR